MEEDQQSIHSINSSSTLQSRGSSDEYKYPYNFTDRLDVGSMRPRYNNIHLARGNVGPYDEYNHDPDAQRRVMRVLRRKDRYNEYADRQLVELYDETVVMMKKAEIKAEYRGLVNEFPNLRDTVVDDTNTTASVFQPCVNVRGDYDNEMIVLNSSDCRLIMKIAKSNFSPGDRLARTPSHQEHYFHFGEKVVDITTSTHGVVIGETWEYAYLLTHESLATDVNHHSPLLPIKRRIEYLDKGAFDKVLNYTAVEECAKMADYVEDTWLRYQYVRRTARRLGDGPTREEMGLL